MTSFQQITRQIQDLKRTIEGRNVSQQFRTEVLAAIAALEKIKVYFQSQF